MTKYTFIGDLHSGNRVSDRIAFRKALKNADRVFLMGDIIEGITKKDKRHSNNDQIDSYSTQISNTIKDLKPYKSKIETYVSGNHEDTLLSICDVDSVELICSSLNIDSCYTKIFQLDNEINVLVTHGTGAASTYGGCVTKMINLSRDHVADYYFMGHTHKLFDIQVAKNPNPFTIVNTGSLLGTPEYAKKRALPDAIKGYYILDTKTNTLEKVVI